MCPSDYPVKQETETSNDEMRESFTAFRMTTSRRERRWGGNGVEERLRKRATTKTGKDENRQRQIQGSFTAFRMTTSRRERRWGGNGVEEQRRKQARTKTGNDENRQRRNTGILHCVQDDDFEKGAALLKTVGRFQKVWGAFKKSAALSYESPGKG